VIDERELIERAVRAWTPAEVSFEALRTRRERKHRRARIRSAALAIVIATASVGLLVRAMRTGDDQPASHLTWTQVDLNGLLPRHHERFWSATSWDGEYVVLAQQNVNDGSAMHLLASRDAVHWRELPPIETDHRAFAFSVTSDGDRLIACGFDAKGGAIWLSRDATSWQRIGLAGADGKVFGVSVTQGRLFAWGQTGYLVAPDRTNSEMALWTSVDGQTWMRAVSTGRPFGEITTLLPTPEGYVAVGDPNGGAHPAPRTWTSSDGVHWAWDPGQPPLPEEAVLGGQVAVGVATGRELLVFGGWADANHVTHAAIWRSADGTHWTYSPVEGSPSLIDVQAVEGGGFVGVGATGVWYSADGVAWTQQTDANGCVLGYLTQGSNSLVAVGIQPACAWTTMIPEGATR
jgi:hypothetical protein